MLLSTINAYLRIINIVFKLSCFLYMINYRITIVYFRIISYSLKLKIPRITEGFKQKQEIISQKATQTI
jgi:hypothetical protein